MVQRKQVRKKPKDSLDLPGSGFPADHVRGGGGPRSRGGGAAMAGTSLPNYMRATTSSDAKTGRPVPGEMPSAAPPKRGPVRAKVVFTKTPYVSRATCSSTMKGSGFPAALDLAPGADGPAAARVCPYAYCSLNGHVHASVVPLGSFLASRRRLIKTQQSMKLKGVSPFRKSSSGRGGGGGGDGFFVEIYAGAGATAPTVSSDVSCSDISTEEMDAMVRGVEYVMFDHRSCGDLDEKNNELGVSVDSSYRCSDVISAELSGMKRRGYDGFDEEKETLVDQEAEDENGIMGAVCKSDISEDLDAKDEESISKDSGGDAPTESSIDDMSSTFSGMSFKDACSDPTDAATCQRNKLTISRRRTPEEHQQMRPFNPRAPNFLPVEPDPEAEKVDLRHQMMDDRKNAEEWMVDYALRRAVKKLARAQKRKVEMLVQAFETVLPPVANEKKSVQHDDYKKSFTLTRPMQACSW